MVEKILGNSQQWAKSKIIGGMEVENQNYWADGGQKSKLLGGWRSKIGGMYPPSPRICSPELNHFLFRFSVREKLTGVGVVAITIVIIDTNLN